MVTTDSILVPVDSIDILGFRTEMKKGIVAGEMTLSDLTRRGLEDRLFVHSAHSIRLYGFTNVFEDQRVLQLLAAQFDAEESLTAVAILASREGGEFLDVTATMDPATGVIRWELADAVEGVTMHRLVFAALHGCDDFEHCEPPLPRVAPIDMAPNELADATAVVIPGVWWTEALPEDDGTVPQSPLPLATIYASVPP